MSTDVVIVEGVSLEHLNPHNAALKNEYTSNLVSTAFLVLPHIYDVVEAPLRIKRGFLSMSYIKEHLPRIDDILIHGKGLALEVTWDEWDYDDALSSAYALYNYVIMNTDEDIKIVINNDRKSIYARRDVTESGIYERIGHEERTIKK